MIVDAESTFTVSDGSLFGFVSVNMKRFGFFALKWNTDVYISSGRPNSGPPVHVFTSCLRSSRAPLRSWPSAACSEEVLTSLDFHEQKPKLVEAKKKFLAWDGSPSPLHHHYQPVSTFGQKALGCESRSAEVVMRLKPVSNAKWLFGAAAALLRQRESDSGMLSLDPRQTDRAYCAPTGYTTGGKQAS